MDTPSIAVDLQQLPESEHVRRLPATDLTVLAHFLAFDRDYYICGYSPKWRTLHGVSIPQDDAQISRDTVRFGEDYSIDLFLNPDGTGRNGVVLDTRWIPEAARNVPRIRHAMRVIDAWYLGCW